MKISTKQFLRGSCIKKFRFLFTMIFAFLFMGTANSQTTILGGWTFDGNKAVIVPANLGVNAASANLYANGTNGSSSWTLSSELDQFGGINTNDPRTPPDASNTLSAVNPSGNTNGKAWVLKLPTTGYQDINLSYATRGTNAGFTTQTWAYSTNGTSFTNIATITGRNVTSWSLQTVDLSGVAALNNATNIYLKVTFTGAGNGGNNRLDNILVKGNELAVAPVVTGGSTTGTVGQSFSYTVSATGSPTSFSSTGTIPPGLTFNTTTGAITGTPTTAGSYTLSVTASNTHGTSPAADVNITINKANQSITFSGPTSATYGDAPVTLTGSSSSSLPVTYVSDNPSVATISGNTLTIVGAGSTFITASQSGNANYNAAADVTIELVVAKADQTITFNALPDKTTDDPDFALTASSTSGLPISYSSSNTAVINISGTTAEIVGAGNSLITASQPGNANYNPATPVDQNQYVSNAALADQTITFPSIPAAVYGDAPVTLNASASSGLTVNYTSSDPSVALVSGNTLIIVGVGTTTITAKQPGNGSYNPAPAEMQDFTVSAKALTISGIVVNNKTYDGTTTASVDLSGASLVGVVGSDDVSFNGTAEFADPNAATGVAIVTNYVLSGADATKYILSQPVLSADILKADQTISFDPISDKNTNDLPFTLNATSTSGLAVTFESSNPSVATVSGNTVSIVGPGSVTITASQDGDLNYNAATDVQQSFNVTLAPTIVKWNFGTSSANPAPSSGVPVNNLNISNFSAGNNANTSQTGLQLNTSSVSNNTGASGQYNASTTAENESFNAATSAYFEFTLTPAAGFTVTLNSLSFGSRSTSTGPTDLEIRTSADNFGSAAASFSQTPNSTWRGFSSNFSGITSSQPLVVRIYGFVQDGSGSVNSSSANNFRIDDVTIDLLVAAMPECSGTPDAGTASAQTSAFCVAGSTDITLTGYTDPLTNQGISIQWYSSTDNVTFTEVTGANAAVLNTGTITQTTYYYNTVTCAASGLSANSNTVEVTINPVPEATISGLTSFCSGNSTTLTASEGASYDWKYEGNSFATSRSVSVNQAGNYTVTVTSAAGCSATSATTVV
ncbi:MAG: putative Ig domain-containing protein, partial [Bacteroidetes bacterium]|nr:putative Ig domain-containing protein [Bacteroidota bacterium]